MFLKESFCGLRFFRIVKPVYILGSAWSIANYTPYSTCFCFSSFVCFLPSIIIAVKSLKKIDKLNN